MLILVPTGVMSDYLPFEEEEEPLKDRLYKRFCSWTCCPCYLKFQEIVGLIVLDAFVDLFITICILANTAFMAADQHPKSPELTEILQNGNYASVFFVFSFEMKQHLYQNIPKLHHELAYKTLVLV